MRSAKQMLAWFMLTLFFVVSLMLSVSNAQQASPATDSAVVPRLVNFSGKATDAQGKTLSGVAGVTFAIYKDQYEGSPLWLETQNIQADSRGNYTVQLGATKPQGLPLDLFTSGEARWLGVTVNGGQEQPRVLLLSVPYALKAADAETVGGLPASAFALAGKPTTDGGTKTAPASSNNAAPAANPAVTGKGAVGFVPMWDSVSDIVDSNLFQKTGLVGVNTPTPAANLDVNGKQDVRDTLTLFPKGTDPTLAINGTAFKVDQTGKVSFVTGQGFPGTGTVTGVGLAAPASDFTVAGSPVTKVGTLNLKWNVAPSNLDIFNSIVKRDANGNFVATTITAAGQLIAEATVGNGNAISGSSSNSNATVIYGGASSPTGPTWAVEGETFSSDPGAYGVFGRNYSAGIGVVGQNTSSGIGVFGTAPNGFGFVTDSNVQQTRTMGGWVKAMAFVNAKTTPYSILNCFNSTLGGAAATTPPCGINFTEDSNGVGYWDLDFGFEVDDRFLSATVQPSANFFGPNGVKCVFAYPLSTTAAQVLTSDCGSTGENAYFYIVVF